MGNTQQNQEKREIKPPVSQHKFVGLDNLSTNNNLNNMKHLLRHLYKNNFVSLTFVNIV
jgi:hypothetical protein